MSVQDILDKGTPSEVRALFAFNPKDVNCTSDRIVAKFNLWSRFFFPKYFSDVDAPFHALIDLNNAKIYKGDISSFLDIVFRNGAKTTRTKLFMAFVIANDENHYRRYIKVLSHDANNSKQVVTDVYNMLISRRVLALYPEIFQKTDAKREEKMDSFTTATGVKMISDTVGTSQRGQLQDEARPDFIVFDDFEDRSTLRSAVTTKAIWDNMEEARLGLSIDGGCIYLCNYISERGNVHKLVQKVPNQLIVPIILDGIPMWKRYSVERIAQIQKDTEDFEGEYLCKPSASKDVLFDRDTLDKMATEQAIRTIADFRLFKLYDPSHRYALGADVAGGVGLDSSASIVIDFSTVPFRVVATYRSNTIKPDVFGNELARQGDIFGGCLISPEVNNHGAATVAILKQVYENIFYRQVDDKKVADPTLRPKEYGWHTNAATKPKMLFALKKAVEDGLLLLSDADLIAECKSYSRDDLMDGENDPRLTTRHFDLLIACAIAYQMKDFAEIVKQAEYIPPQKEDLGPYPEIWH